MEYCIVYLSSSAGLLSEEELNHIKSHGQKNNGELGITGVLLYCNGNILEVLEGTEEQVKNAYDVISHDRRHRQVMKLYTNPIEKRAFKKWNMGFKTTTTKEFDHIPLLSSFLKQPMLQKPDQENAVLGLVQTFYQNNYRN